MRRGCLIAAIIVPLLSLAAAAVALFQANQQYGIFLAPTVSHETLANENTRVRVVARLDDLIGFMKEAMPPEVALPAWFPYTLEEALPEILPHEVAVLGGADYRDNDYDLTFFVNERRGGPFIAQLINEAQLFSELQMVKWDEQGMLLQERGVLSINGALPMPIGMEDLVTEHWPMAPPADRLGVEGGHLFELVLDNRAGDAFALWGTLTEANGENFQDLLYDPDPQTQMQMGIVMDTLPNIHWIRAQADLINPDAVSLVLRAHTAPESGPGFTFIIDGLLPQLQLMAREEYGIKINGDFEWREEEEVIYGEFTITEFRKPLLESISGTQPAPTAQVQ